MQRDLRIILHNIRSAHNVGTIFRTADACGVSRVYVVGYTPAPIDRFGRQDERIKKTALGAETTVPWEECADIEALTTQLRNEGMHVRAVERSEKARDIRTVEIPERVALVFGNEIEGVSGEIQKLCDDTVEIPMLGKKESLNVAVAAGIALFVHAKTQ